MKKVFVGLSGGVDSAVSAGLLKEAGFDVTGVFIKAWTPDGYPCTWKEDRRSAMRAAAVLDIPFHTLDLEKEYKRDVVDYMIREYKNGRTPNPDVMCNKEIKFGGFLKWAREQGADFVATGHYAQRAPSPDQGEGGVGLKEGADKNKDQTYFLWTLSQDQLRHTLFPIGHLQKSEVRKLAEKFGLPQATRKDSQGLCFLGQIDMKEFLHDFIDSKEGKVLDLTGQEIGSHDGAVLYTLGERHGLRIFNQTDQSKPFYVVSKDIKSNTITVAPQPTFPAADITHTYQLEQINWISGKPPRENIECRYRYRQPKIPCRVNGDTVTFESPQLIASGQSIVFYLPKQGQDGDEICLGGAIIS